MRIVNSRTFFGDVCREQVDFDACSMLTNFVETMNASRPKRLGSGRRLSTLHDIDVQKVGEGVIVTGKFKNDREYLDFRIETNSLTIRDWDLPRVKYDRGVSGCEEIEILALSDVLTELDVKIGSVFQANYAALGVLLFLASSACGGWLYQSFYEDGYVYLTQDILSPRLEVSLGEGVSSEYKYVGYRLPIAGRYMPKHIQRFDLASNREQFDVADMIGVQTAQEYGLKA